MTDAGGGVDRTRLGELFDRTLSLPPAARAAFVADSCRGDPELQEELISLLAAHTRAPGRLERMAGEVLPAALHAMSHRVLPLGRTVSHYRLEEIIGGGGMGVVYKARDLTLDRYVALKFLRSHLTGDVEARRRLELEARAASALDHPNIAVVYEIGTAEGVTGDLGEDPLFIAMAYYSGETIQQKTARGPLPISEALGYAAQVADGLARAHEEGIIHRDIKPANVIVTDRGEVKILDFGIARSVGSTQTRQGFMLGTLAYMSPKQTRGETVDHRTDVWGVGATLYEMLTGKRAFAGDDDAALIQAIRHEEPERLLDLRPEIPAALARIVETCLAKEPDGRYQQTGELLAALQAIESGGAPHEPPARRFRRVPRLAAAGVLLAALVLVASIAVLVRRTGSQQDLPTPDRSGRYAEERRFGYRAECIENRRPSFLVRYIR